MWRGRPELAGLVAGDFEPRKSRAGCSACKHLLYVVDIHTVPLDRPPGEFSHKVMQQLAESEFRHKRRLKAAD